MLGRFTHPRKLLKQLTPENQKAVLEQYHQNLQLDEVVLKSVAFAQHTQERIHDVTGFKGQIGENKDDTLSKMLAGTANETEKTAVKTAIANALKKEPFYESAKKSYEESVDAFKKLIEKVPETYQAGGIRDELERIQNNARKAIEAQQKKELEAFKTTLDDTSKTPLKAALNTDDSTIDKIKKDLVKELEKTHDDQLKAFDKTAADSLTILDKAAATARERLIFTIQLLNFSKEDAAKREEMLAEIERVRDERLKEQGKPQPQNNAVLLAEDGAVSVSGVDINKLAFIYSLTGKKIEQKDGVWTVTMSPRIYDPGYYIGTQDKPMVDLLTVAQAIRASGFEAITTKVSYSDPDTQKQMLRKAYEAALKAGFPDGTHKNADKKDVKYITIIDGQTGKEVDPKDIFTASELQILHGDAAEQRKRIAAISTSLPKDPPTVSQKMKADILAIRNEGKDLSQHVSAAQEKSLEDEIKRTLTQKN